MLPRLSPLRISLLSPEAGTVVRVGGSVTHLECLLRFSSPYRTQRPLTVFLPTAVSVTHGQPQFEKSKWTIPEIKLHKFSVARHSV